MRVSFGCWRLGTRTGTWLLVTRRKRIPAHVGVSGHVTSIVIGF